MTEQKTDRSGANQSGPTSALKRERLPNHVAIIMDGNGRWAKERRRPRVYGHRVGVDSVREVVKAADQLGIKVLSLFAFSEENWGRPEHEVSSIMTLLNTFIIKERAELKRQNVQFRTMGRLERLPPKTQTLIEETRELLASNTGLVLNIGLSYGSRHEIADACRRLAAEVERGELKCDDITPEALSARLSTWDLPEPDLLIRTSGEQRLSNFMLWEMAYAEFYFTKVLWPDFRRPEFEQALDAYAHRQRRYGLVLDQQQAEPGDQQA